MSTDLFDLSGRIALVTGASRGIGEQIARLLAAQGALVIISSRRPEACEEIAQSIRESGCSAEAMACHGGDLDAIHQLFADIRRQHGRLDILVNNAGTNPYYGPILETEPAAFDKTVDVNLRGYFFMSVEAGKLMRENSGGAIVNVASINAIQPGNLQGIYSITKAAVVNMTKAFAQECAEYGIRCNAILPGLTNTKLASGLITNTEIHERIINKVPLGRHAEPEEMAGTVLLLVSDAGSYITGESIVIDGGLTIASAL